jgi:hypothetical protein
MIGHIKKTCGVHQLVREINLVSEPTRQSGHDQVPRPRERDSTHFNNLNVQPETPKDGSATAGAFSISYDKVDTRNTHQGQAIPDRAGRGSRSQNDGALGGELVVTERTHYSPGIRVGEVGFVPGPVDSVRHTQDFHD